MVNVVSLLSVLDAIVCDGCNRTMSNDLFAPLAHYYITTSNDFQLTTSVAFQTNSSLAADKIPKCGNYPRTSVNCSGPGASK